LPALYQFGNFQLNVARYELRRNGRVLKLEKIPMELLILLVGRHGELVSREEIIAKLWGRDVFIETEHGVNTAVRKIRQTLGDDPEQSRFVQTVVGKGYRFVAAVNVGASDTWPPNGSQPNSGQDNRTLRGFARAADSEVPWRQPLMAGPHARRYRVACMVRSCRAPRARMQTAQPRPAVGARTLRHYSRREPRPLLSGCSGWHWRARRAHRC